MTRTLPALATAALLALAGCVSLDYDLAEVPVPISAKPADGDAAAVVPMRLEAKNVLWVHGLFGHAQPDVAGMIAEAAEGYDRIADFRITQSGGFHDWLIAHLSGTLLRMKSVVVEGQLIRDTR